MEQVYNPKGRVASVLSIILWSLLTAMLVVKGVWDWYSILLMILFVLLLVLSLVRIFQEWKEGGLWLG